MRWIASLTVLAVAACSQPGDNTYASTSSTEIPLYEAEPDRRDLDGLTYLGGISIEHSDQRFGGWSALQLNADGSRLLAVSDSADWMTAELRWNDEGAPVSVAAVTIAPILGREGQTLTGEAADSETIADLGNGQYAVSFEREHRINTYDLGEDWSGIGTVSGVEFPAPPGVGNLPNIGGLEGLTTLPGGYLLAAVEYPETETSPRTFWLEDGQTWIPLRVTGDGSFGVTALHAHGEHVYIMARFWRRGMGNRIRLMRLPINALGPDRIAVPELLGTLEAGESVDNFEGLHVFDRDGETVLVILSDDNFNDDQRTLLMAFTVDN